MAATGRMVWVPGNVKGLRVTGWENKIKNMPEEYTSDYMTLNVFILDDVDPAAAAGAQGNAAQLKHAQWCNNMRDTFNDTVADCSVKSIRMQNGQRSRHLLQRVEEVLQGKTEDDLVVFCFHGTAGGDGSAYNFNLTGPGPNRVNAHELIAKANESSTDCLFILDCYFPTSSITQWKREDHMTEIIIAGREMHDVNGRPITGPENFDEAFSNTMRDILANPRGEARQTIPRIMGRDKSMCCTPQRYWLNKPNRMHPEIRVWRFFIDIGRLKIGDGDKLQIRRCKVTGRRKGEFGGDPDLDNDGWGPGSGDDGDDGDVGDDDNDSNDRDDGGARYEGGDDEDNDGDSSNGGWGRGFGRTRRRTPRRESAEDQDAAGDEDKGDGNDVAQQWTQLHRSLGLPKKLSDEEAIDLVKRLQCLPTRLKRRQPSGGQPTPASSGICKRARAKRPLSTGAEPRGRSEVAVRPRRSSSLTSDWEILSVQRVGDELGSPIAFWNDTTEEKAPPSELRKRMRSWLQDTIPKSLQNRFSSEEDDDDDDKASIKLSDSPAPRDGGRSSFGGMNAAEREISVDSDFEIISTLPVVRRGAFIDLTGTPVDLTEDLDSLFIPEQNG